MGPDTLAAASGSGVLGVPAPWAPCCLPVSTRTAERCHPAAYGRVIWCGGELQVLHAFSVEHLSSAALLGATASGLRGGGGEGVGLSLVEDSYKFYIRTSYPNPAL